MSKGEYEIIKIEIWNKETKHKSGAGRAIVGGMIAGGAGAIVGAATKKDKELVTFKITYKNGHVEFVDTMAGDVSYNFWIKAMQRLEDGGLKPMSKGNKTALKVLLIVLGLLALAILLPIIFR